MDTSSFLGLVQNAALLLAVAFLFDVAASRWHTGQSSFWQVPVGLVLGAIGTTVMLTPWTFGAGIVFDTRSVLLGISGLFFGSVSAAIAMAMTAALRYYLGGSGAWTGVAVILVSGAIGIAWRHFRRRPLAEISWRELYLFGMVIHLAMLGLMLTLPWITALRVLSNIALPVILIYPLGTALLGFLMVNRLRREQTEGALLESEKKYRLLFDNANEAIFVAQDGKLVFLNPMTSQVIGYSPEELMGRSFIDFIYPDDQNLVAENYLKRLAGDDFQSRYTFRCIFRDGGIRWLEIGAVRIDWTGRPATLNFVMDITERKQLEEAMRESEDRYRSLFDNSIDAVLLTTPDGTILSANPEASRIFGRTVEELCRIGRAGLMDLTDPRLAAAMEERDHTGQFRGELTLVRKNGTSFPGDISSVIFRDRDGNSKTSMIIRDITDRKRSEEELQQTLESLRKSFGATIQVMVSAVESRDPYTAGHQIRSADLARAMATELGLSQARIDGIRMAGTIHDIGKLSVPAEILSKPTKLSELEFAIIKEHAQKGFNMLKDVESPWPLAEIVHQHHERMDGSGYPRQLKGEEILMEARILAVADVVESMASHRPYRPALGLNAALAEIENNKGTLYDTDVVEVCLRLFREKGFQLEGG